MCAKCSRDVKEMSPDELIYDRGYWWHKPCAKVFNRVVYFPSDGKIIPRTILRLEQ